MGIAPGLTEKVGQVVPTRKVDGRVEKLAFQDHQLSLQAWPIYQKVKKLFSTGSATTTEVRHVKKRLGRASIDRENGLSILCTQYSVQRPAKNSVNWSGTET
jgi:hypothetical protein